MVREGQGERDRIGSEPEFIANLDISEKFDKFGLMTKIFLDRELPISEGNLDLFGDSSGGFTSDQISIIRT